MGNKVLHINPLWSRREAAAVFLFLLFVRNIKVNIKTVQLPVVVWLKWWCQCSLH